MAQETLAELIDKNFREYADLTIEFTRNASVRIQNTKVFREIEQEFREIASLAFENVPFFEIPVQQYFEGLDFYKELASIPLGKLEKNILGIMEYIEEAKKNEEKEEGINRRLVKWTRAADIISAAVEISALAYMHQKYGLIVSGPMLVSAASFIADAVYKKHDAVTPFTWAAYTAGALPIISIAKMSYYENDSSLIRAANLYAFSLFQSLLFGYLSPIRIKIWHMTPDKIKQAKGYERALKLHAPLKNTLARLEYALAVIESLQSMNGLDEAGYRDELSDLEQACCRYLRNETGRHTIQRLFKAITSKTSSREKLQRYGAAIAKLDKKPDVFDYLTDLGLSEDIARRLSSNVSYELARQMYDMLNGRSQGNANAIIRQSPFVLTFTKGERKSYFRALDDIKDEFTAKYKGRRDFSAYLLRRIAGIEPKKRVKSLMNQFEDSLREVPKIKEISYIDADAVIKADKYNADFQRFPGLQERIGVTEKKIQESSEYNENYHKGFISDDIKEYLHARVTGRVRIVYRWDPAKKELTYLRILNHDEFDRLAKEGHF